MGCYAVKYLAYEVPDKIYKVGEDIIPGLYKVISYDGNVGKITVSGVDKPWFEGFRSIVVSLESGMEVQFSNSKMYYFNQSPIVNPKAVGTTTGVFHVGTDIPGGYYFVSSGEKFGTYYVYNDLNGKPVSQGRVEKANVSIELKKDQYLYLNNCSIKLNNGFYGAIEGGSSSNSSSGENFDSDFNSVAEIEREIQRINSRLEVLRERLNNILSERNYQVFKDGQWVWSHDEVAAEKVREEINELTTKKKYYEKIKKQYR